MKYTKQYPGYKPQEFIYGFIGKNFPVKRLLYSDQQSITENKEKLAEEVGESPSSLCFLEQVHGNKCHIIKDREFILNRHKGDAAATNIPNIVLTVHTADCVPILFFDKTNKNIAIAHAGWKGALSGVIQNTIAALFTLGSATQDIEAMIGPCITQDSYEVGPEFYEKFVSYSSTYKSFFIESQTPKYFMFNLPGFVMSILKECNIRKISYLGQNTYNSKDWFSYREDTHKNNKTRSGHIISFIGIK